MRAQVLIGPLDVPWITDFGLSTSANMTSMSQSSAGGRGTLPFKAPELFTHPPVLSAAADVYAYAVLAWTVVAGEQPFATFVSAATALPMAVLDGERPGLADGDDWKERTTGQLAKLIEACWDGEAENRPAFGSAGGEGKGIVAVLEKLETSLAKNNDEASVNAMATRLLSAEAEAEEAHEYLAQIDGVIADETTTASEAKELKDEREGVEVSAAVVRQNAFCVREQMTKASGGDELVSTLLNVMVRTEGRESTACLEHANVLTRQHANMLTRLPHSARASLSLSLSSPIASDGAVQRHARAEEWRRRQDPIARDEPALPRHRRARVPPPLCAAPAGEEWLAALDATQAQGTFPAEDVIHPPG